MNTATWTLQSYILRTTFRQCTCGERHEALDIQEFRTTPLPGGQTGHQYLPVVGPMHHTHVPVVKLHRVLTIPFCPACVHRKVGEVLPSMSEERWLAKIKTEEREAAETKRSAPKTSPAVRPTLEQLSNSLFD